MSKKINGKDAIVGVWYERVLFPGSIFCCQKVTDTKCIGYGVTGGSWVDKYISEHIYSPLIIASRNKIKNILITEAKRRGFKDGVVYKEIGTNRTFTYLSSKEWGLDYYTNTLFGKDGLGWIFKDGKWAEIIGNKEEKEYGDVSNISELMKSDGSFL